MVAGLLTALPTRPFADLIKKGCVLDNFYVSTRYPNRQSEGTLFEHDGFL